MIGWSDLNNPDNFFATNINEADEYAIPYNSYSESVNYGLTGLGLLSNTLWLYTTDGMSSMDYVGLPNVMQILPRHPVGNLYPNGLVVTKSGHYFIGRDNVYYFDGVRPKEIGDPIFRKFYDEVIPLDPSSDNSESVIGYHDLFRKEVSWTYWTTAGQQKQVVYSIQFNRWFFRNLPYESANKVGAIGRVYGSSTKLLYGGVQKLNFDYDSSESTADILLDDQASSGYTQPLAETNDIFYDDLYVQKEGDSFYLDAGWSSGVTGLELSHSIRQFISTAVSWTALTPLWVDTIKEGKLSLPRKNGRVFRFKFKFSGTKPVGSVLNAWGDMMYGAGRGLQR
jgi:hypothetical protein